MRSKAAQEALRNDRLERQESHFRYNTSFRGCESEPSATIAIARLEEQHLGTWIFLFFSKKKYSFSK